MNLLPPSHRRLVPSWGLVIAGLVALAALGACASRRAAPVASPVAAAAPASAASATTGYPFAAARTRTQDYFGATVADDFAWLDDAGNAATRTWIAAENAYGRHHLDAMPARAALRQRLQSLVGTTANVYTALAERGGVVFALKAATPQQPAALVALKSLDDPGGERVLFDPAADAAADAPAIAFFRPSMDGRRVALGLSATEGVTLRVLDVATGRLLPDQVASSGDVAWSAGNAGFFFTRTVAGVAQVAYHALGAPAAQDGVELSDAWPRGARVRLASARDGRRLLALVTAGSDAAASLYLRSVDANNGGHWRRLAAASDGVRDALFGDDDAIWIDSVADAPHGKLLRLPLAATARTIAWDRLAPVAVPQDGALQRFAVAGGHLYVVEGQGGATRLRAIDLRSRRASVVALPPGSGVAALARVGRGEVVAQVVSELQPPSWTRVAGGRAKGTVLAASTEANFSDSEVLHELASSRDGTPVPLAILRRKGTRLDGRNAVLLTTTDASPDFDPARRVWLDRGGVVVRVTLRADRAAALDDFIAAADELVTRGYTQPSLLGVEASGDGALVAALAMTRRPTLVRALVGVDGRYDLLAAGKDDAPADRAQFDAALAGSPLHAVRDGIDYPAVLLLAGGLDAAQSRRMAARLQQADPHGRPLLLLTDGSSGQAPPTAPDAAVDQATDEFGFLLDEVLAAQ